MSQHIKQGAVDVIAMDAPLIFEHLESVSTQFEECLQDGQPQIVFDLKSSPMIDSEGLELLVDLRERCHQCGGNLKLAGLNPLLAEVLRITRVKGKFEIYDDVRSAVRSFL